MIFYLTLLCVFVPFATTDPCNVSFDSTGGTDTDENGVILPPDCPTASLNWTQPRGMLQATFLPLYPSFTVCISQGDGAPAGSVHYFKYNGYVVLDVPPPGNRVCVQAGYGGVVLKFTQPVSPAPYVSYLFSVYL